MFLFSEIPRSEGGSRQKGVDQTIEVVGEQKHLTPQMEIEKTLKPKADEQLELSLN